MYRACTPLFAALFVAGACSPFGGYHSNQESPERMQHDAAVDAATRDAAERVPDAGPTDAPGHDAGVPPAAGPTELPCIAPGKGTAQRPCVVTTCAELQAIASDPTGVWALGDDIDCRDFSAKDGDGFLPIGSQAKPFTGVLNGRGHVISNLEISRKLTDSIGLFGLVRGAELHDFGVRAVSMLARNYAGAIVGIAKDGAQIARVFASGDVGAQAYVGGLIGDMIDSSLQDSYSLVHVVGQSDQSVSDYTGLLVARVLQGSKVAHCYAQSSDEWSLPPLIGDANDVDSSIERCYYDCSGQGGSCYSFDYEAIPRILLSVPEMFAYAGWDYHTPIWGERSDRSRPCLIWERGCTPRTGKPLSKLGGEGTSAVPFEIGTCQQLQSMSLDLDAIYALQNDVDCAGFDFGDGSGFMPVGLRLDGFRGELRGMSHSIRGLRIMRRDRDTVGLFSRLGNGAKISDLSVEDAVVLGDYDTGVIAGAGGKGVSIVRCRAQGLLAAQHPGLDGNGLIGRPLNSVLTQNTDEVVVSVQE